MQPANDASNGNTAFQASSQGFDDPELGRLGDLIASMGSVLVCYSGGVDSAFVLAVAHRVLGDRCVAMTAISPSLAPREEQEAVHVATLIGARHERVPSHEIENEGYAQNGVDRCFYCKSELYDIAATKRAAWGLATVVNGTNLDDLGDYRPGLDAASRAGVRSPLVEARLTKGDVRRLAKSLQLPIWDKPAAACLSSRLPYGARVTRERLLQIGSLEAEIRTLGIRQVRVRWHSVGNGEGPNASTLRDQGELTEGCMARIEVGPDELDKAFAARQTIAQAGRRLGFVYVTLDLAGYRTGSHNELLTGRRSLPVIS